MFTTAVPRMPVLIDECTKFVNASLFNMNMGPNCALERNMGKICDSFLFSHNFWPQDSKWGYQKLNKPK